jgi:hypothetical protein
MWRTPVPTENEAWLQAPEGAGTGCTWSFRDGVRGVWTRGLGHGALQQSYSYPGALLATAARINRYWTRADGLGAASWRQGASACERHGVGPGQRHGLQCPAGACDPFVAFAEIHRVRTHVGEGLTISPLS